ncbi:MAG: hypothetical protein UY32_C0024G0008 [Candidatus Jorgensenbacteria bacterium GW2011_GWC1_48_8]|uniref:Uncharacterized protein n=1 Tax=Candidatus Jorgensenbacteria bacterium GW2011_GWC1_48_8 TaxID=1618666 RepID=A0A0G1X7E6_9BACT|nr:MAG: hypothetical protein UY32_C0024G0008 [Candidatus Jorgensenbacteria bacterium GW2011_GWC1_48_8]
MFFDLNLLLVAKLGFAFDDGCLALVFDLDLAAVLDGLAITLDVDGPDLEFFWYYLGFVVFWLDC